MLELGSVLCSAETNKIEQDLDFGGIYDHPN